MCRQSKRSRAQAKHTGEGAGELAEEEAGGFRVQAGSLFVQTNVVAISQKKWSIHFRVCKGQSVAWSKASIVFPDIEFVEAEIKLSAAGLVQKLRSSP